jgi:hypothetical protein
VWRRRWNALHARVLSREISSADRVFQSVAKRTVAESAPTQDVARSAHLLGELVGLALRSVTVCPMELNLRPASVVRRHDLEKRRPFFIAAAACILLALLGWSAYYTARRRSRSKRQRRSARRTTPCG